MSGKIRIGIICPSEIAFRRFMPALKKVDGIEYVGVGINSVEERYGDSLPDIKVQNSMLDVENAKAGKFVDQYGGIIFTSYENVVTSSLVDAVYIPLPPALHFKWAKKALICGKHVLLEKPSTIYAENTKELVSLAEDRELALHENYMFIYHKQLDEIDNIISTNEIGEPRLYRVRFGFPQRAKNDFRYDKDLGGGALIDAAGYTIKYATRLIGSSIRVLYAKMNYVNGFDVDIYGSGALVNDDGVVVQIAYGMDNDYKCELEVWGSKGTMFSGRVLTSPAGFTPSAVISNNGAEHTVYLSEDDAFMKSIEMFIKCIKDKEARISQYKSIVKQAELVDEFRGKAL